MSAGRRSTAARRPPSRERDPRTLTHVERQGFTEAETAAYLHVSRAYLRQRRMRGSGPPYAAFGRMIRYRRRDLDAWWDGHLAETAAGDASARSG